MSDFIQDSTLVQQIADARDTAALDMLYDRHSSLVFSVALRLVGDESRAEQVTLDIFTRVWEKATSYKPDRASVRTWLVSMARNRAIDMLRRANTAMERRTVSLTDVQHTLEATSTSPEQETEAQLEAARVRAALNNLPPEQLQVIQLAYYDGYTRQQIAEELDLPLGTVKSRVRLAMVRLRAILLDEHADP